MKKAFHHLLLIFMLLFVLKGSAQETQFGVNLNFQSNRFIITEEEAADISLNQGLEGAGYAAGVFYFWQEPRNQVNKVFAPRFGSLIDLDVCRCASRISVGVQGAGEKPSLLDLNYLFYRTDLSPKATITQKKLGLAIGPKISLVTFVAYNTTDDDRYISATADFNRLTYGIDAALFYNFSLFNLTLKYNRQLTPFATAIMRRQTKINNRQFIISLSIPLGRSDKGINHDSIIWN